MIRKLFKGFTLAEVLITIGILGILATMTVPTLMTHMRAARNRGHFKKALSTLNQAVRMNKSNFDFDFSDIDPQCANGVNNPENILSLCAIMDGNLTGQNRLNMSIGTGESFDYNVENSQFFTKYPLTNYNTKRIQYTLADGTLVVFYGDYDSMACTLPPGVSLTDALAGTIDTDSKKFSKCIGFVDVNNTKGPNREISCLNEETKMDPEKPCKVGETLNSLSDIFPIAYHDGTVVPATNAVSFFINIER